MKQYITDIKITILYNDTEYIIYTYAREYRSLMQLICDRIFIEDFGECRGMGRCGTCLVKVLNHNYSIEDYGMNELSTITKQSTEQINIRLACQIRIDQGINGLAFEII